MGRFRRALGIVILVVFVGRFGATAYAQAPDVHFVPTPDEVVTKILQMARVTSSDIVYDLGCGDGRIVITAAKVFGARGVGVDIDSLRIKESNANARKAGVTDRVKFLRQDLFQTDIREATVVTLYLLPELNLKLRPKLFQELQPGTRIVSHEFDMGDWKPDNRGTVRNVTLYYQPHFPMEKDVIFYYWVLPADVAGTWRWSISTPAGLQDYSVRFAQNFQEIRGVVNIKGQEVPIADARLVGNQISFAFRDNTDKQNTVMKFNGHITGDAIKGNIDLQGGPSAGKYEWTARRNL